MTIDNLFDKVPFDEAYKRTLEDTNRLKDYKAKGAELNGTRPLDIAYTAFAYDAAEYQLQFNEDELMTLLGKALHDQGEIKLGQDEIELLDTL